LATETHPGQQHLLPASCWSAHVTSELHIMPSCTILVLAAAAAGAVAVRPAHALQL
jgi:hypothetical protein